MDDYKTEKWTLNDGRRAERRVMEQTTNEDGQVERVVELHVEDERPLKLQQRVVEKSKPIVYERRIETLDTKTGEVVEQKVESIEPRVQMQLVEHIAAASSNMVSAQSVEDCNCHVTKEEMIDTIVAAIKATRENPVHYVAPKAVQAVEMQSAPINGELAHKLHSLGLADEIGKSEESGMSYLDYGLSLAVAVLVAALGYVTLVM